MFFGWFYYDWTILIVLPAMLFALWAQFKVNSTFEKYNKEMTRSGKTAAEAARVMLNANGLTSVGIQRVRGHLSDHYNPRDKTLYLSESVHDSRSASAIGVACHEAGHAIQDARAYGPLKLRMGMIPVCNIGSGLAMPLFLIGLLFAGDFGYMFMLAGAMAAIRNPKAHENMEITKEDAIRKLHFASMLMYKIDNSILVGKEK